MGLILLNDNNQSKTFYATNVQAYSKNGVAKGHLPPSMIAAACLPAAKASGCEDIVICPDGLRPRRYTVKQIEEYIAKKPEQFRGFVRQPPQSSAVAQREKAIARYLEY